MSKLLTEHTGYFNVRFTSSVDESLRRNLRRRGDLSRYVLQSLRRINLRTVALLDLANAEDKAPMTQVGLPQPVIERVRKIATARGCSLNCLVNSAVQKHCSRL
jgi:hypothetical protein